MQQPAQGSIRTTLRIAGPIVLLVGLACFIVAAVGMFTDKLDLFWLAFVGLPLMFVGSVLCMGGFYGAVTRFMAGEAAPVATDAAKYVAEETKGAVETVAKAAAKGVVEGIRAGQAQAGDGKD